MASFCNPRVEGSFDIVNLSELVIREGRNTVLRHQNLQFVEGINAPRLCASFNERGFGVLIPAEKKVLAQPLRMDLEFRLSLADIVDDVPPPTDGVFWGL